MCKFWRDLLPLCASFGATCCLSLIITCTCLQVQTCTCIKIYILSQLWSLDVCACIMYEYLWSCLSRSCLSQYVCIIYVYFLSCLFKYACIIYGFFLSCLYFLSFLYKCACVISGYLFLIMSVVCIHVSWPFMTRAKSVLYIFKKHLHVYHTRTYTAHICVYNTAHVCMYGCCTKMPILVRCWCTGLKKVDCVSKMRDCTCVYILDVHSSGWHHDHDPVVQAWRTMIVWAKCGYAHMCMYWMSIRQADIMIMIPLYRLEERWLRGQNAITHICVYIGCPFVRLTSWSWSRCTGLKNDDCVVKMRLLSLCSLAVTTRVVKYADIAQVWHNPATYIYTYIRLQIHTYIYTHILYIRANIVSCIFVQI